VAFYRNSNHAPFSFFISWSSRGRANQRDYWQKIVRRWFIPPFGISRDPTPAPVEGAPAAAPARRVSATDEMITELFVRFDTEMKKFTEAKGNVRSDLFSRMSGNNVKSADLSAGLRHNINLMLQHVSR
jgi:hypothetical protein